MVSPDDHLFRWQCNVRLTLMFLMREFRFCEGIDIMLLYTYAHVHIHVIKELDRIRKLV